jgi:hypothetical protein
MTTEMSNALETGAPSFQMVSAPSSMPVDVPAVATSYGSKMTGMMPIETSQESVPMQSASPVDQMASIRIPEEINRMTNVPMMNNVPSSEVYGSFDMTPGFKADTTSQPPMIPVAAIPQEQSGIPMARETTTAWPDYGDFESVQQGPLYFKPHGAMGDMASSPIGKLNTNAAGPCYNDYGNRYYCADGSCDTIEPTSTKTDDRTRNYPELITKIHQSRNDEYPFYKL